jgi:transposase
VSLRRQASNATVKALHTRRQDAYRRDDVRVVRRIRGLLGLLTQTASVPVLCERWGLSPSCLSAWQKACLVRGLDSLISRHSGGRPEQGPPRQKKRVRELVEAGPLGVGLEPACWTSVLSRVLIWRECGVLSNRHDVCTWLDNLGVAFQKARFVSDHLDAAKRLAWLQNKWLALVRTAKRGQGLRLLEEEASCAPWGSCSSTWARRGHQPAVPTRGQRKGYKVFGAMEYFSGRLFHQAIEGRFHAASSQAFLQMIMAQTSEHLCLIHDGAREHTSASTQAFLAAHSERITVEPLPSYAPDDHPIASLWKKTKQRATHNQYVKGFAVLTVSVDKALA